MSFSDYGDLIYRARPVSSHVPMERSRRAKQFAPFDALKGFEEAIRAKETGLIKNNETEHLHHTKTV